MEIEKLNFEIESLLKDKLAPLKFEKYMFVVREVEVLKTNLSSTLNMLKKWCNEIFSLIGEVEVESGFATGGVIKSAMGKDDGLIKVKKGETVLTEKFTKSLPETTEKMQAFINKVREQHMTTGYLPGLDNPIDRLAKQVERETRAVENFISNNNSNVTMTGDIIIHLDGSNVMDMKSFQQCAEENKNFLQHMFWDEALGKGDLNYKRYRKI